MIDIAPTVAVYLRGKMKPDVAILSKLRKGAYGSSGHYNLDMFHGITVIRFDGSLFFLRLSYLEKAVLPRVGAVPNVKYVLALGNGINKMEASGSEIFSKLVDRLRKAGLDLAFSDVNGGVLDGIRRTGLFEKTGEGNFCPDAATAVDVICSEPGERERSGECP